MIPFFSGNSLTVGFVVAGLLCLGLGVFFPFYDFFRARQKAAAKNKPLPGKEFLLAEFRHNDFLGSFCYLVGAVLLCISLGATMAHGVVPALSTLAGGIVFLFLGHRLMKPRKRKKNHR